MNVKKLIFLLLFFMPIFLLAQQPDTAKVKGNVLKMTNKNGNVITITIDDTSNEDSTTIKTNKGLRLNITNSWRT